MSSTSETSADEDRPMPHIPQELVDQILDELDNNVNPEQRTSSLVSCNTVSRSFRSATRKHLFSEVSLAIDINREEGRRSGDLRALLESFPDSPAPLVRSFIFRTNRAGLNQSTNTSRFCDRNLPAILKLLPSLRKVTLEHLGLGCRKWANFSDDIKAALWELHDHPSITFFGITDARLALPVELVSKWTSLKSLSIIGSAFSVEESALGDVPVPVMIQERECPQLEKLKLVTGYTFLPFLKENEQRRSADMIATLQTFEVIVESDPQCLNAWTVIGTVPGTLRALSLHVDIGPNTDFWCHSSFPVDFHDFRFETLREVEITDTGISIFNHEQSPKNFSAIFAVFGACKSLESLRLDICFRFRHMVDRRPSEGFPSYEEMCIDKHSWSSLDQTLVSCPRFRKLDFHLGFTSYDNYNRVFYMERRTRFEELSEGWTPQNIFPLLFDLGSASFSLSTTIL